MGETVPFASNYTDVSTYDGYQFEFYCRAAGTVTAPRSGRPSPASAAVWPSWAAASSAVRSGRGSSRSACSRTTAAAALAASPTTSGCGKRPRTWPTSSTSAADAPSGCAGRCAGTSRPGCVPPVRRRAAVDRPRLHRDRLPELRCRRRRQVLRRLRHAPGPIGVLRQLRRRYARRPVLRAVRYAGRKLTGTTRDLRPSPERTGGAA